MQPPAHPPLPGLTANFYGLTPDQFFKRPDARDRYSQHVVNVALLEAAVFQQTNLLREQNHLPDFQYSAALNLMARRHSGEMASLQYFDHASPTPANRTLAGRFANVGLPNVTGGENISVLPAREIGSGHYLIRNNADGTQSWTDAATGLPILYDSYEEFARTALDQWMNSPEHRRNILDKRFLFLGIGAARGNYGAGRQDSLYLTQNFSATVDPAAEVKADAELRTRPGSPATRKSPP